MEQHFNQEEVLQRLGGDAELLQELLDYAQEDIPEYLASIEQAVQANNAEQIQRSAHKMKGFARNLSFTALAEYSLELEKAAGDPPDTLQAILAKVKDESANVQKLIGAERES